MDRLARARVLGQEQLGVAPLLLGHRLDHGLDLDQLLVVGGLLEDLVGDVSAEQRAQRHLVHQVAHRPHGLDVLDLGQEVVHPEPAAEHLLGVGGRLLLVDDLLEVLHQADEVAHAEDSAGEALGPELLELVEALAHAEELDRLAGRGLDRQRRATAGVTVELGQDHAGQAEPFIEGFGGLDRVLTDHRVDDQEHVGRVDRGLDVLELEHQGVVDGQAPGGVVDDVVEALDRRLLGGVTADVDGVGPGPGEHRHAKALAEHLELVDRRRAVDVGGDEHDLVPVLLQLAGELAGAGRLPRALEADHHDPGDALRRPRDAGVDRAHQVGEGLVADLDEVVLGADPDLLVLGLGDELDLGAQRPLLDVAEELLDRLELDVGLEQAQAHVLERLVDDVLGQLALAGEPLSCGAEALGDGLEHGGVDSTTAPPV